MPHEPGMTALILGGASALLAFFAMARIAWIDMRQFEIDPDWAAIAGWAILGAIITIEGPRAWPSAVGAAVVAYSVVWLATLLLPAHIGAGETRLFALCALALGPGHFPRAMVAVSVFLVVTRVAYGLARGRWRRRCPMPAALPLMAALGPAFVLRMALEIRPDIAPGESWSFAFVLLAGSAALAVGLLAVGFRAGTLRIPVRLSQAAENPHGSGGRVHQRKET